FVLIESRGGAFLGPWTCLTPSIARCASIRFKIFWLYTSTLFRTCLGIGMPLEKPKWAPKRCADEQGNRERTKLLTQIGAGGSGTKQQEAELRDLIAAVYHTFLIPAASPIASAMKRAGQEYHAHAKQLKANGGQDGSGGGHDILGPPFLHVFKALVKAAHETEDPNQTAFWTNQVLKEELHSLAEQIRHCRSKDTRKKENAGEMMRITICFSNDWRDLEAAVCSAIKKENGVKKIGPPPRGPLAREASKLLEELNNLS
ncbi:unnamed protein product, partial [Prorocentrum cordatum]